MGRERRDTWGHGGDVEYKRGIIHPLLVNILPLTETDDRIACLNLDRVFIVIIVIMLESPAKVFKRITRGCGDFIATRERNK